MKTATDCSVFCSYIFPEHLPEMGDDRPFVCTAPGCGQVHVCSVFICIRSSFSRFSFPLFQFHHRNPIENSPVHVLALPYIFTVYFPMKISSLSHFTNADKLGSLRTNYTDSWLSNQSVGHFPQNTGVIIHRDLL